MRAFKWATLHRQRSCLNAAGIIRRAKDVLEIYALLKVDSAIRTEMYRLRSAWGNEIGVLVRQKSKLQFAQNDRNQAFRM